MRWRYCDTNSVSAAVESATVIKVGDFLWQDVDQAKPASARGPDGEYGPQFAFARSFLGVAMQRSRAGDADPIRVATTGVFEFDCDATDFELGDIVGPKVSGKGLLNQQVEKVSVASYAVGRCAKRGAGLTSVLIDIRSTVMTGGIH